MIYIFLADGCEEIEALTPCDLLRRAGHKALLVGVNKREIIGAHGIHISADITTADVSANDDVSMIVLPGGVEGTENLKNDKTVCNMISACQKNGKYIAAICAAPTILGEMGILNGKTAVCYPSLENKLIGAQISAKNVVCDDNIITGKGMGVSIEFGLMLVSVLDGDEASEQLKGKVIASGTTY
ncbi:MAG: DJ-1/PfpI family protein [Clostridia bacterium]|nr:DJ-1/PfpI family protein [Clostridia bacterium]